MGRGGKRKGAGRKPLADTEKRKTKVIRIPESKMDAVRELLTDNLKDENNKEIEVLLEEVIELISVKAQRNVAGALLKNREKALAILRQVIKSISVSNL
jgi:hypothetical protein